MRNERTKYECERRQLAQTVRAPRSVAAQARTAGPLFRRCRRARLQPRGCRWRPRLQRRRGRWGASCGPPWSPRCRTCATRYPPAARYPLTLPKHRPTRYIHTPHGRPDSLAEMSRVLKSFMFVLTVNTSQIRGKSKIVQKAHLFCSLQKNIHFGIGKNIHPSLLAFKYLSMMQKHYLIIRQEFHLQYEGCYWFTVIFSITHY